MDAEALRTVEIRGPAARGEGVRVLRWAVLTALASLLVMGRGGFGAHKADPVATYQVRFASLPAGERRLYGAMREGLAEAERVRGESGAWPTVKQLADDGVPPFAPDPLAPGLRWTLLHDGPLVGYLGTPATGGPTYLIWVQEPQPGVPGDPPNTPADEVHHPIAGGIILHVGLWLRDTAPASATLPAQPWLEGWKQVIL